jgi:hypothetical protein
MLLWPNTCLTTARFTLASTNDTPRLCFRQRRRVGDPGETKILHAPDPTIAPSGLLSKEFRFGSLFAPAGIGLPRALKVEHEKRTRLSQSCFRSPSARHRTSADGGLGGGVPQHLRRRRTPGGGRNNRRLQPDVFPHRRIKPHAYILSNIARVKTFPGRKVRVTGRVAIPARTLRRNG